MKDKIITYYDVENDLLTYNDGIHKWSEKFYIYAEKKEFRLYDVYRNISKMEIAIIINEILTYHYYIFYKYLPNNIPIEDLSFVINGHNVSTNGYDMLTYYITELNCDIETESTNLYLVKSTFKEILKNVDILGKEPIIISFYGSRLKFLNFYMDLIHVIECYNDFPDGITVEYAYKKRIRNHYFYILPVASKEE